MRTWLTRGRFLRLWVSTGVLLQLGGCGLSDQQLTGILSSVITTGLSQLVNTFIAGLGGSGA